MNIIERISETGSNKDQIAHQVIQSPEYIPQLLEGLNHDKGNIKFGCEKVLRLVSEQQPEINYPYFDDFVKLLDSENKIKKWGAIITISNLSSVDTQNKFEKIFKKYYALIKDKTMITAANVIINSWKIVLAKPELAEEIRTEILMAEKVRYENKGVYSPECTNIICGHMIDSFEKFFSKINDKKSIVDFIKRQLNNTRKSVAKKANKFLIKNKINI
jgi:hypothetical protein